jgi:RNA polymerase sigma-70 factor (ECF subfamily)
VTVGRMDHLEDLSLPEDAPSQRVASAQTTADILAVIPNLRAFAVSLCGNLDRADDLVQETLVKAWSKLGSFVEGTNLRAWLFTILRNIYYSEYRKRRREVADSDGTIAAKLATAPAQNSHMDMLDFRAALQQLPTDQREALILIGGSGLSYEEAAGVCGCAVGTMKSRVNRARGRLADILSITSSSEFGDDGDWQAIDPVLVGQRYSRGGSE